MVEKNLNGPEWYLAIPKIRRRPPGPEWEFVYKRKEKKKKEIITTWHRVCDMYAGAHSNVLHSEVLII